MKKYKRLVLDEREEISRMLAQGCSLNEIAKVLDRAPSTVSREVQSGGCNKYTYRAGTAQRRAWRNSKKRKKDNRKIDSNPKLRRYIERRLRLK